LKVRVTVCGGQELAAAAAVLGLIAVDPAKADLALVDLRDTNALPRAAALAPELPRVVVAGDDQLALAAALGFSPRSIARTCEPAMLGPLIGATLPAARRTSTRSVLVTSVRGGVGRSMLVANLARRLAPVRSTITLDLTGSGALGWWLGAGVASWSDLEGLADELTAEHLGVVATEAAPGLRMVGGPPHAPSARLAQSALRAALELSELVLLDAPILADERTRRLSTSVDRVLVVTYDDPASIALLASADLPETTWLIASQSAASTVAGREIFRALPRDESAVAAAANRAGSVGGALGVAYESLAELIAIDAT
jgi:MinD-like ATPase involved in chromosome partitioning or flagellar assembly